MAEMLEGYECPAILVTADYRILATNQLYQKAFGRLDHDRVNHCFSVSHGYDVPCDQAGEDCPLGAALASGHKERVLHIHQSPHGKEHVDVEMLPIHDPEGNLQYFVELLRPVPLASGAIKEQELVGESDAFKAMLSRISRVGLTDASVLLLGESGTGKELAARAIHQASERRDKAMVTLECAGLTDSLFETELFGHVKGAFTGAHADRKGLVELADGGTLFLDELGDIPMSMQVKLLRLLETGTFRPVGSVEVRRSDFRLICATHKNLLAMVENDQFRADLFYRINVFPIYLPALAERIGDIPLLARALLQRLQLPGEFELTKAALQRLSRHHYKGNVRELRNLLHRATVLADNNVIGAEIIETAITEGEIFVAKSDSTEDHPAWVDLKTREREYIKEVFAACGGDKEKTARTLGISTRSLYRKLASA